MRFGVTEKKENELLARMEACGLKESDIEEAFIKGSGPGGQNVNKTATSVYLKHIPTGSEVKCGKTRSQLLNRFYARRQLCELLEARTLGIYSPKNSNAAKVRKQKDRRARRRRSLARQENKNAG